MRKALVEFSKILTFSLAIAIALPLGLLVLPIPWALFFPPLFLPSFAFTILICVHVVFLVTVTTRVFGSTYNLRKQSLTSAFVAIAICVYLTLRLVVRERGASEIFGPTNLTYFMLFQASAFAAVIWHFLYTSFWSEHSLSLELKASPPDFNSNVQKVVIIAANLIVGNSILYFHEIYGRHQQMVATSMWMSFSCVAILFLWIGLGSLKSKESLMSSLLYSLVISFLIPSVGFWVSMEFSLVGLFTGVVYLFFGFVYLIFPMFILNFIGFRWYQKQSHLAKSRLTEA